MNARTTISEIDQAATAIVLMIVMDVRMRMIFLVVVIVVRV
jgi:hypothetical protein